MAAFPLYSPLICPPGWEPNFVASSENCVLQSGSVSRSRLLAGGSLFRSVETVASADVNNIVLELVVGLPVTVGDIDTYPLTLTISGPMLPIPVEVIGSQSWDTLNLVCVLPSGVSSLRAAVSAENTVITMPPIDTPTTWTDSTCLMTSFGPTRMGDGIPGIGLPDSPDGIRTGPTYSLFHVAFADTAEDGSNVEVNAISEWDGVQNMWVANPSPLYEVGNASNPCP